MASQTAVMYLRTSSAANVGDDKDSDKRQRAAVVAFARANKFEIVAEFYDAVVSGADPVEDRRGFAEMLDYMLGNGARTVLVESPDRFARDLAVQIAGHQMLQREGIDLIPTTAPTFFTEDTPTAEMVRNILGAVSQFDRRTTVARLKGARDRKSEELGRRIEGQKGLAVTRPNVVGFVQALSRQRKSGHFSNPDIVKVLHQLGIKNRQGKSYSVVQVRRMVLGPKVEARSAEEYLLLMFAAGDVDDHALTLVDWKYLHRFMSRPFTKRWLSREMSEKARIDFSGWRNDLSAWVRQQREVRLDQVDQDLK
jgi:DNA invertase Pin-like site-specific DNA recombinase